MPDSEVFIEGQLSLRVSTASPVHVSVAELGAARLTGYEAETTVGPANQPVSVIVGSSCAATVLRGLGIVVVAALMGIEGSGCGDVATARTGASGCREGRPAMVVLGKGVDGVTTAFGWSGGRGSATAT